MHCHSASIRRDLLSNVALIENTQRPDILKEKYQVFLSVIKNDHDTFQGVDLVVGLRKTQNWLHGRGERILVPRQAEDKVSLTVAGRAHYTAI